MKSVMKSFNMENAVLPTMYTSNSDIMCENGFRLSAYELYDFLKLEVGKKYYTFYHKSIMAFKVLRIVYFSTKYCHTSICYEARMANGYILRLDVLKGIYGCKDPYKEDDLNPLYKIFATKEDILEYRQTQDESLIYNEKCSLDDIINKYFIDEFEIEHKSNLDCVNYLRDIYEKRYYNNFFCKGYFLNKDSVLKYYHAYFKYLWVDEFGGHYQVYDMVNNVKVYPTKEEALNTLKIVDFDDEENDEVKEYITLNLHFTIRKGTEKDIMKGLLEQQWTQGLNNETDFYKQHK